MSACGKAGNAPENRGGTALWVTLFFLGVTLLGTMAYLLFGENEVDGVYIDRFIRYLSLSLAACVITLVWLRGRSAREVFRDFFLSPSSPVDLAVFRIVVFAFLLTTVAKSEAVRFSGLPLLDRVMGIAESRRRRHQLEKLWTVLTQLEPGLSRCRR